jgi:molecular chaperone DnaK
VDQVLIDWLLTVFKKEHGIDLTNDKMVLQRLKEAAEKAKKELSNAPTTEINLPFLTADNTGPKHLITSLKRSTFEQMIEPVIERTLEPCRRALADAKVSTSEIDEVVLVGGSTRIPLVQKKVSELFGKEPNRSVNPDEVVAMGAAIQGGVLSGDVSNMVLLDVTPLSLGIETLGGICHILISRNTTIPVQKSEVFSTAQDNQNAVDIQVSQGERQMAKDNRLLGKFRLEGIELAPKGIPQIEVIFDIDANGILNVTAKDKKSGKEQQITIQGSSGLSKDEIEKMVEEAEAHEASDKEKRDLIEASNKLDNEIYQVSKLLDEHKEKVPADEVEKLEQAIADATEAKDSEDVERMKAASESLMASAQKLSQIAYAQQPGEDAGSATAEEAPQNTSEGDDDIIDVDFEDAD